MAFSDLMGPSLLGFRQGQAAQSNQASQLDQIFGSNNFLSQFGRLREAAKPIIEKQKTLRQELQAEVDEWLPDLAA